MVNRACLANHRAVSKIDKGHVHTDEPESLNRAPQLQQKFVGRDFWQSARPDLEFNDRELAK